MMFLHLKATHRLFLGSVQFALKNKFLIIIPLVNLIVTFSGLVLLGLGVHIGAELNLQSGNPHYYWYLQIIGFLTLVSLIVAINTFSSALLVYMANFKLSGEETSLKKGFSQCWAQRSALMSWGVFFTCAGFILTLLSRIGNFKGVFFKAISVGWHLCAFLVMPFIIIEKLTPSLAFEK